MCKCMIICMFVCLCMCLSAHVNTYVIRPWRNENGRDEVGSRRDGKKGCVGSMDGKGVKRKPRGGGGMLYSHTHQ